jgi:hypothetical protein
VETKLYKDAMSVIGGVNNIFDRSYYARIRADGLTLSCRATGTRE